MQKSKCSWYCEWNNQIKHIWYLHADACTESFSIAYVLNTVVTTLWFSWCSTHNWTSPICTVTVVLHCLLLTFCVVLLWLLLSNLCKRISVVTVYCLLIHVLRFSFSSTRSLDRLFSYPLYPIPFTYYISLFFLGSFPSPTRLLTRGSFTHSTTHQPTHLLSGSRTQSLARLFSRLSVLAFNCFLFLAVSVFIYLGVKPSWRYLPSMSTFFPLRFRICPVRFKTTTDRNNKRVPIFNIYIHKYMFLYCFFS